MCINCILSQTFSYLFILYLVSMNMHNKCLYQFLWTGAYENLEHTHVGHAYLIILSPCLPFQHFGPAPLTGRPVWPLITLVPLPLSSPISRGLNSNPPTHHWTVNAQCLLCATIPPSLSGMCDTDFFFSFFFRQTTGVSFPFFHPMKTCEWRGKPWQNSNMF